MVHGKGATHHCSSQVLQVRGMIIARPTHPTSHTQAAKAGFIINRGTRKNMSQPVVLFAATESMALRWPMILKGRTTNIPEIPSLIFLHVVATHNSRMLSCGSKME